MKKKIVYISGAETFDVKDVRAAFDEVRSTLGLDSDTILFGVPIDEANESAEITPCESVTDKIVSITPEIDVKPVPTQSIEDFQGRDIEQVAMHESEPVIANSNVSEEDVPVVPIQSILTSETKKTKSKKKTAEKVVAKKEPEGVEEETAVEVPEPVDTPVESEAEHVEPVATDDEETISVQEVKIEEMITDEMPVAPAEKTLEELLESMTPLREDVHPDTEEAPVEETNEDADATLENLASEFADAQAKIPDVKKTSGRGKIGKLKGIIPLPFSKKKKDDSGIMGDLFGWAGFAANDDDFTIPGFFTNAAGKK